MFAGSEVAEHFAVFFAEAEKSMCIFLRKYIRNNEYKYIKIRRGLVFQRAL